MTPKEYLLRYQKAYNRAQLIEQQIVQLRLKYALPSAIQYSDMPKSHNTGHDLSEYVAKIDGLRDQLIEQYCKCMGIEGDILKRLDRMDNEQERQVLVLRYTHITESGRLMRWEDVAYNMNYSYISVTRIHGRALQHFPINDIE